MRLRDIKTALSVSLVMSFKEHSPKIPLLRFKTCPTSLATEQKKHRTVGVSLEGFLWLNSRPQKKKTHRRKIGR